ncbi:MAG: prepilin peptidase [Nitrospirae bacterium]|nr:prepilin peptidase [Nitrospirota bacterium]MBI3594398.1 prepilin peptidase [Nitrospirota bacterium]
MTLIDISVFILGTLIGSFLNVVIYRIPREESIVFPSSHCPLCRHPIFWYDNIPLFGFLFLKGRCRFCHGAISIRYPFVEAMNGLGYLFLVHQFGLSWIWLAYSLLYSSLLAVTFIDLDHQIVPDVITLPGLVIGVIISSTILPTGLINSLIGLFLGGGLFYLVALVSRGGMGGGDIKLIAMIGAFAGWKAVLLTIFISAFTGSVLGIILMIFKGKSRKYPVPFGPFLALGAMISILWGNPIIYWYTHLGT